MLMLHLWVFTRQQCTNIAWWSFHQGTTRKRLNTNTIFTKQVHFTTERRSWKGRSVGVMLISWVVPTQNTHTHTHTKPKAFCSNPVLTGPHVQSKCVAKHSLVDTSHVISAWPMRESRLSIQSDWLRSVHVANQVTDQDADAKLEQY